MLSALHTGRLYPSENIPGTHFCYRLRRPQGHSSARRITSLKNSSDTVRSRTFSLVTQCLNQLYHRVSQMGVVACLNTGIEPLVFKRGRMGTRNRLDPPSYRQWDLLLDFIAVGTGATGCISQPKEGDEKFLMTEH